MTSEHINVIMINILGKIALTITAYHFYVNGELFLAGLFAGWILIEIITLVFMAIYAIVFTIWR